LKNENEKLKGAGHDELDMRQGNHHMWEVKGEEVFGQYCVTCWEIDQRKISMVSARGGVDIKCPKCQHPMMSNRPPDEWGKNWRRNH